MRARRVLSLARRRMSDFVPGARFERHEHRDQGDVGEVAGDGFGWVVDANPPEDAGAAAGAAAGDVTLASTPYLRRIISSKYLLSTA